MSDLIPSSYVRVKFIAHNGRNRSIYLEQVRYTDRSGLKFISGYEVNKQCESKKPPKGVDSVIQMIQLGDGVTVIPQLQSKKYGDLYDA